MCLKNNPNKVYNFSLFWNYIHSHFILFCGVINEIVMQILALDLGVAFYFVEYFEHLFY